MKELLLYTTVGCHLCEQAEEILAPVLDFVNRSHADNSELQIVVRSVEIVDSPELMDRYGVRIPVIRFENNDAELGWPFDHAQAFEFLSR